MLKWSAAGVFLVLPGLYVAYRSVVFARTSSLFQLDPEEDLVVSGSHFSTRDQIAAALEASRRGGRMNAFRMSLGTAAGRVESIAWVRSAIVMRSYPHRLIVNVIERTPVAYANVGGRIKLVDADGVLLDKPEKAAFDFPVIDGLDAAANPEDRKSRVALYQEFSRETSGDLPSSGWLVSEIDLSDLDDLKTLLVQGKTTLVVHFGHRDFGERLRTFLTLLPEVRRTTPVIDAVDLRYQGQIVVNPELSKAGPK